MKTLFEKPHLVFLTSVLIFVMIGFLIGDATLDINIHDTYYVIGYQLLLFMIAIICGIMGFGYWTMLKVNRKLSKSLSCMHIALTFGGSLAIFFLSLLNRNDPTEYKFNITISLIITFITLTIAAGQILFPINIIYGLINKRNKN